MEKQKLKKSTLGILLITLVAFLGIPSVFAQTDTTLPLLSPTATPSITISPTVTETPSVTVTATPTPSPTQKPAPVNVRLEVGTQYPWNKRIPVTLYVTPLESGEKLEIRWQKRTGLLAAPLNIAWASPQAGVTYKASFTITPQSTGYQRAVADVIITTFNSNYVSSKDLVLNLNKEKVVQPQTSNYLLYQILMYVVLILVFLVLIPYLLYRAFLYIKNTFIPKWLESKYAKPQ